MKPRHQTRTTNQRSGSETSGGALQERFLEELKDLYDAERQLIQALPKVAGAAEHEELRTAFESHLKETEEQVRRIEQVFQIFQERPSTRKCKGMQGLIEEGNERIKEEAGDAALICAAQKIEHYEIAAYGSLAAWAKRLGRSEVADILHESLEEEKQADQKLTEIAETVANAAQAEAEEAP